MDVLYSKQTLDLFAGRLDRIPSGFGMYHTSGMKNIPHYLFRRALLIAASMFKINLPIHVLPFILFKLKLAHKRGLWPLLAKLIKNIAGSTAFLTFYCVCGNGIMITSEYRPWSYFPQFIRELFIWALPCVGIAFE